MKKKTSNGLIVLCSLWYLLGGCSKTEAPCSIQAELSIQITPAEPCLPNGIVRVVTPTGAGFQYKLGSRPFRQEPRFDSVAVGAYDLLVEHSSGCKWVKRIVVDTIPRGILFEQVRQVMQKHCVSCHAGFNPQAGIDLSRACDIVKHWDRIEARAVLGTPSPMPQGGLISLPERNLISAWIRAGHRYSD